MGNGELVCDGLTKVYDNSNGKKALDSVSLSVPARGILSLIGMNGAGKTTLVRILATQLAPTSGDATIDGTDVIREAKKLRKRIAVIPQEARTVPWMTPRQTVLTYLMWRGLTYSESKKKATEALTRVGMEQQSNVMNRRLSGGMKRKVLVATVLAADADVCFLDEPTTGLDPVSRRELWGFLNEIARKHFLILTTHYLEEAEQLANSIGIMDKGKMIGIGTLESLRGSLKHQYSIRLPIATQLPQLEGVVTSGRDGVQILTNEAEAYRLSQLFLSSGTKFSVNRVSLDDVFFHYVHADIEGHGSQ